MGRALYFRGKGVLVGSAFVVIGSMLIWTVGGEWWTGMRSRRWSPVMATIVASERHEVSVTGSDGVTHAVPELDFRYRYDVDGRSYESDRLSFTKRHVDVRDIPAFLARYPVGSTLTVYYDPRDPERAVIERGVPTLGILFVLMPGFFVVLGPLIIWGSVTGAIVRFCERHGLRYR